MKRRIFFGLAPLFILLLAMGVYAVTLFAKLGGRIDHSPRKFSERSGGQEMKETAERMDSAYSSHRAKRTEAANCMRRIAGLS